MARDYYINGESLVRVKGRSDSAISSISQLGLAEGPIQIRANFRHLDCNPDAWGSQVPAEVQWMLADATITMMLIHFDPTVLAECWRLSMGGAPSEGYTGRAGQRMGNNQGRFAPATNATGLLAGNNYIGLNINSPVQGTPWRFWWTYLTGPSFTFPLGTEKSVVQLTWRAIPYTTDPYNNGYGAYYNANGQLGGIIWDHQTDD